MNWQCEDWVVANLPESLGGPQPPAAAVRLEQLRLGTQVLGEALVLTVLPGRTHLLGQSEKRQPKKSCQ